MSIIQIAILAIVQGLAELLPVSSSAHVIIAQKLMGLDPSSPEMTFLLVMLHTGTMFAVILFFGKRWISFFRGLKQPLDYIKAIIIATGVTGVIGLGLKIFIEKIILEKMLGHASGEVEALFRVTPLVAGALFLVGIFIFIAGSKKNTKEHSEINNKESFLIGLTQGLSLPFRGFSRSGSTISTSMFLGIKRETAEEFSFLLAVILTPAVVLLQLKRLLKAKAETGNFHLMSQLTPGLIGMVFSFLAGLIALKWLSSWLESGKWKFFGIYCLVFSICIFALYFMGII